ncbi:Uncharacterised protein [Mycobacteroides abscessus subsp. massiliense]|nr:Uncharacterised protein [Mycobacteroides abscessus subsp. massiliense]
MRSDHRKADILQKVHVDHALLNGALPQHIRGFGMPRHRSFIQVQRFGGASECLQRAHTSAHQFRDHVGDDAVRQTI